LSPKVTDLESGHIDAMSHERFAFLKYIVDLAHDEMWVVICTDEKNPWFHAADNLIHEAVASLLAGATTTAAPAARVPMPIPQWCGPSRMPTGPELNNASQDMTIQMPLLPDL
jgi:hypothetical protein